MNIQSRILAIFIFLNSFTNAQQTVGLFQNDPSAFVGYTLFAPLSSTETYLIDNCGRLINSWSGTNRPGNSAYLMDNGNLLRTEFISSNFNEGGSGGRLLMMDWEGNVVWSYDYSGAGFHQHHDFEIMPNGNILLIAWTYKSTLVAIENGRDPDNVGTSFWPDHIVEIEPVGTDEANIVWKWELWDHMVQDFDSTKLNYGIVADHPELADINFGGGHVGPAGFDWSHCNAIDYNPDLDQILLSSFYFNEIWIIDHSTTTVEAAGHTGGNSGKGGDLLYRWGNPQAYQRGTVADQQFYGQHNARWIPEGFPDAGKIMVFNNGKGRPSGDFSTVDVITPSIDIEGNYILDNGDTFGPVQPDWSYTADPPGSFFSENIAGAQRLSNGNTLICEGRTGRFFEIDPIENQVWEYVNPVGLSGPVTQGNTTTSNQVFKIERYTLDFPGFQGKDLTPGEPLELEPLPSDCQIYTGLEEFEFIEFKLYPNPFLNYIRIETSSDQALNYTIYDLHGIKQLIGITEGSPFEISTFELPGGVYFILFENNSCFKIVKF